MSVKRYVKQNPDGAWAVLKEGELRSAVTADTQSKAVARARDIVRREGGGEIRVVNRTGKIVNTHTAGRGRRRPAAA